MMKRRQKILCGKKIRLHALLFYPKSLSINAGGIDDFLVPNSIPRIRTGFIIYKKKEVKV